MSRFKLNRRRFGLGALGMSLAALSTAATPSSNGRRFIFVHAMGGWDPLCVFAPLFSASAIQMEADSAPVTVGGFSLVDHPSRPGVVPFFEKWGNQTLLINGLSTRSVNHETCQIVALTGATSDSAIDWPTMLAVQDTSAYYMPHLVFGGPAFPGSQTVYVSRAEGLVQQAVDGTLLEEVDQPLDAPSLGLRAALDSFLSGRASKLRGRYAKEAFAQDYETAVQRAQALAAADVVNFPPSEDMADQAANAVQALADGVARCATISGGFAWDTHGDNSEQSGLFEGLFAALDALLGALQTTTGPEGQPLSDDTVVVVLSEMGRTPAFNATMGRDHWPYTSALLIGPGITGGRTIGGYTDLYAGIGVDPNSGELDTTRPGIDAKALGATLLALGGADPGQYISKPEIITGVLA